MIGGILHNSDINIFLASTDIHDLDSQVVKGIAIRIAEPETQIPLELEKDAEKSKSTIFTEEGDIYRVFVSPQYYIDLKTKGFVGTRNALGWKIDLTSENYAGKSLNLKSELRLLNKLLKSY